MISSCSASGSEFGYYTSYLQSIVYNYNMSVHTTTKSIPFYLFLAAKSPYECKIT